MFIPVDDVDDDKQSACHDILIKRDEWKKDKDILYFVIFDATLQVFIVNPPDIALFLISVPFNKCQLKKTKN